ncbi:dCTP deaminase [Paenibacillus senegalensis]|uniref:dCTP deaminase n=1 Tax=Paenibacillus senegalensis TaxID=1465766 RepID=UPI000288C289|nr:dCTP deaminase [Paenibacillus senegalensis]
MILSDRTIREWIRQQRLIIEPLTEVQIQPASVDLRLGTHFLKVNEYLSDIMALDSEPDYEAFETGEVVIPPQSFLLATTVETIRLPGDVTAFVEGRSSIGRMGLFIQNAGWVDPGFEGQITLELFNASRLPIKLSAGRRICQLVFAQMDRRAAHHYSGKYQGQRNAVGSRIHLDSQ